MSVPSDAPIETTKLLVIPQPEDLAARIMGLRKAQAQMPTSATLAESFSRVNVLGIRRQALRDFGHSIKKESKPAYAATGSLAKISTMADDLIEKVMGGQSVHEALLAIRNSPATDEPGIEALPALGALVIDADKIDQQQVQACHALVLQNVPISLVDPLVSPTSVGGASPNAWHLDHIHADLCHQNGFTGRGVTVGVLDTGIDASHPEFTSKSILFQEFDWQGNPVTSAAHDSGHHGTHVSGLIAGRTVGVAPDAALAVAAVLTSVGTNGNYGYLVQIAKGMEWLAAMDTINQPTVFVMNGSFGGKGYDPYYYRTLQTSLIAPGSLLIAAIGNSGQLGPNQDGSPGNYDIVIGVGATDQGNNVCAFSDWGTLNNVTKPDLSAPGQNIWSSLPAGVYGYLSGTSMASPLVAGTAALLLQKYPALVGNPSALEAKIKTLVQRFPGAMNATRGGLGTLDLTTL